MIFLLLHVIEFTKEINLLFSINIKKILYHKVLNNKMEFLNLNLNL